MPLVPDSTVSWQFCVTQSSTAVYITEVEGGGD